MHNTDRLNASELAKLDSAMRRAKGFNACVRTRFEFFIHGLHLGALSHLNALGTLEPQSQLSERSLDCVFEDGDVSDEVVRQLMLKARSDAKFEERLRKYMGDTFMERNAVSDLFASA